MKLQKLIIHNIASIEDATIDFATEPLSNNELFLITGKTGSGKSTILDAICLALYANTPRLKSTNMQGDVQDGAKSMKINDPRQLMRHNTSEAFVSLTFLGNNQTLYEAGPQTFLALNCLVLFRSSNDRSTLLVLTERGPHTRYGYQSHKHRRTRLGFA